MNTIEQAARPPSREQYVEELADPDDYWMTLTDSARATRRQEVTIRRWVTSGELPVRRYRVGLNKRTRQVRASDLAKLTPIIDTSAMISGEEGQLNLVNIPAEQAAIRAEHQRLLSEVTALRGTLADYKQVTELALAKHQENWQQALDMVQALFNQRFAQHQQLIEAQQQAFELARTELLERLSRQGETAQQQIEQLQATLTTQGEQFREAFQAHRREVDGMLAEQRHEAEQSFETLGASLTQANELVAHRLDSQGVLLAALERTSQERGKQHQYELQMMREHAQQEQEAMAQQIAALATQLAEHQLQQEQGHQHLLERLTQLQEQFIALDQHQQRLESKRHEQDQEKRASTER